MKAKWVIVVLGAVVAFGPAGLGQTQALQAINVSGSGAACEDFSECRPALVVAGTRVFVVWVERAEGGTATLKLARSTDGGNTFSAPQAVAATTAPGTQQPALAVVSNGNLILAWTDARTGDYDVNLVFSSDNGSTWSWGSGRSFINISDNDGDSLQPSLAGNAAGMFAVAWSDDAQDARINPEGVRDVFLRAGIDPGQTGVQFPALGDALNVSRRYAPTRQSPAERPAVALGGDLPAEAFIAWQQRGASAEDVFFHQSAGFFPINVSNTTSVASLEPAIAAYRASGALPGVQVVLAWTEQSGSRSRILSQSTSEAGVAFNLPEFAASAFQVSENSEFARRPSLASDGQGRFYVAWESQDLTSSAPAAVRVRSLASAFGLSVDVSSDRNVPERNAINPALAADDAFVYVAWMGRLSSTGEVDLFFVKRPVAAFR